MAENVNHPEHYQGNGSVECIDAIVSAGFGEGMCLGSAMKYIWRHKHKNGIEDLKKARWYLDYWIGLHEPQVPHEEQIDAGRNIG